MEERVLELGYIRRVGIGDLMLLPAQLASSVNYKKNGYRRNEKRGQKKRLEREKRVSEDISVREERVREAGYKIREEVRKEGVRERDQRREGREDKVLRAQSHLRSPRL